MAAITCPKCGTENPSDAMNCRQCRINLQFALEHPEETERVREVDEAPPPPPKKAIVTDVVTVMKLIIQLIVGALLGAMLVAVVGVIVSAAFKYGIYYIIVCLLMPAMGVLAVIEGIVATAPCIALGALGGAAYALYRLHKSKRVHRTHSYLAGGILLALALALALPLLAPWRERMAIAARYTDFRESYNSGEYEQAYSFMSPAYRQIHSIEQFKADFSGFNSGPAVLNLHELDARRSITFVDDKAYLLPDGTGALGPNIGPKFEFEKVEGTWYLSEAWTAAEVCIAEEEEAYSWEYADIKIESDTHSTSCQYTFIVQNTSDENQHLFLYEKFDDNATQWDDEKTFQLSSGDYHEGHYSHTKYDDGVDTFHYATKLLILRGGAECLWLTGRHHFIRDLQERHAVPLENPCWQED